jgi:hypothetical protein
MIRFGERKHMAGNISRIDMKEGEQVAGYCITVFSDSPRRKEDTKPSFLGL